MIQINKKLDLGFSPSFSVKYHRVIAMYDTYRTYHTYMGKVSVVGDLEYSIVMRLVKP